MGLMDELKKLARPYAEDEEDFEDEYEDEYEEEPAEAEEEVVEEPKPARSARAAKAERTAPAATRTAARPAAAASSGSIVNLHTNSNLQVILVKPDRYENVSEVADHLRNKCAVVLNLESTNTDTARRLVDFLSGCAYAVAGKIKKVALSTYISTPYNVDIVGDLMEEIEGSGVYF